MNDIYSIIKLITSITLVLRLITLQLFIVLFISCGSSKISTSHDYQSISITQAYKPAIEQLYFEAIITPAFKGEKQTTYSKIYISSLDSILMFINGPLSIPVGKFYSNKDYFVFYSIFLNEAFEGNPKRESLMETMNFPFDFLELLHILRCEPLLNAEEYTLEDIDSIKGNILFKSSKQDFVDFANFSILNKSIIQYQRKNLTGDIVFNIVYDNFSDNEFNLPSSANIRLPAMDGSISLLYTKINLKEKNKIPYSFKIPDGIKRTKF